MELCDRLGDKRLKIANSIRLANLYQWQQKYQLSEALLEEVLRQCQSDHTLKSYLDFAYQHLGKCKFDRGRYKEALHYFDRAFELRQQKGDLQLIDSTQLSLDILQRILITKDDRRNTV